MGKIKMKKPGAIVVVLFFSILVSFAQASDGNKERKHYLGMHAGSTTGFGVSYRYWPKKFGIQATIFPYLSSSNSFLSLGISGLMKVHEMEKLDVFLYLGNHFRYYRDNYYYDYNYNQYETTTELNWSIGFGGGLNIRIARVLRLNLMTGLGNYDITKNYQLTFAGEIGFYYTF